MAPPSETQTSTNKTIRPTKKQRELLSFIEGFITEHGYSPSYREIRNGCNYNSIATVSLHVNSLIDRGHLRKRDNAARSLEVVEQPEATKKLQTNEIKPGEEKWLIEKIEYYVHQAESDPQVNESSVDELYVLISSLKILGLDGAAQSFIPRLSKLRQKIDERPR